jgi:23S rRNA pseudouridine1911/1915/1917 synthase
MTKAMSDTSVTYKFSGHLNSNLFVRASVKSTVTDLWSSHIVPIVNQHFSESILHDIKGALSWDECLRQLLKMGAVYLDQKRMNHDFPVDADNVVRIHLLPRRFDTDVFNVRRDIVFQNEDFLVVNKPALLPVHPTVDNSIENLLSLLKKKPPGPIFSLHRLDVETTGLILFAKSESAMRYFHKLFENRNITKIYKAVVSTGEIPLGHQRHWMEKKPRSPKKIRSEEHLGFQPIELNILRHTHFEAQPGTMIVDVELLTGKTHQIRSQLAHMGFPLVGDSMYGGAPFGIQKNERRFNHFLLHAFELHFVDPKGLNQKFQLMPSWL